MKNSDHVKRFPLEDVINPGIFKSCDWPGAQCLETEVGQVIARSHERMLAQRFERAADCVAESNRDLWQVQC